MPYQNEFAPGDSLWHLMESPSVKEFEGIIKRSEGQEAHELPARLEPQRGANNIKRVVAIDGSTVTHQVRNGYPGAEAALLNLAAIVIKLQAIRDIPRNYIPGPSEIRDMEQCRTLSAVLPGRNIVRQDEPADSPKRFFRTTISKELAARLDPEHETLLETLRAIDGGPHRPDKLLPLTTDRMRVPTSKSHRCKEASSVIVLDMKLSTKPMF